MTPAEAISTMKFRLNRGTSSSQVFEDAILSELQLAQTRLENGPELPWFLLSERAAVDLDLDEERMAVPADFLRENEEDDMQVQDLAATLTTENYTELRKYNMDQLRRRYPDEETGKPKGYAIDGNYFRLRPIPDATTYRLWMNYYFKDDVLIAAGPTNLWLTYYPDLLTSEAGLILANVIKNQSAFALYQTINAQAKADFIRIETARKEANFDPNPED